MKQPTSGSWLLGSKGRETLASVLLLCLPFIIFAVDLVATDREAKDLAGTADVLHPALSQVSYCHTKACVHSSHCTASQLYASISHCK